jgi:uncharacterized RDD family membrane protein YckC
MGGLPPPPGTNDPPPPAGGYPPPPSPGGWPAAPAPGQGGAPPQSGPFGAPSAYGPPPGYGYGAQAEKAGFWTRFAAAVLDGIITSLFAIPAWIAFFAGPRRTTTCTIEDGTITRFGEGTDLCDVPTGGTWAVFAVLALAAAVAAVVYFAKLEGGPSGQTVGKRALGIRVVDSAIGGPIGTGRAVGRYFARILSALVCYLGYLWMLWDPEKQTWHDKLANSYVVKA